MAGTAFCFKECLCFIFIVWPWAGNTDSEKQKINTSVIYSIPSLVDGSFYGTGMDI